MLFFSLSTSSGNSESRAVKPYYRRYRLETSSPKVLKIGNLHTITPFSASLTLGRNCGDSWTCVRTADGAVKRTAFRLQQRGLRGGKIEPGAKMKNPIESDRGNRNSLLPNTGESLPNQGKTRSNNTTSRVLKKENNIIAIILSAPASRIKIFPDLYNACPAYFTLRTSGFAKYPRRAFSGRVKQVWGLTRLHY